MEVTFDVLDITRYEQEKILPATLIAREPGALWITREAPIDSGKPNALYQTNNGDKVRIPLYPYINSNNEPALALAFVSSLAIKALNEIPDNYRAIKVHIAVGNPVQEVDNLPNTTGAVLRFWIGFGFQIKEYDE